MLKKSILAVPMLTTCLCIHAQTNNLPKYEVGFNAGSFVYQGDLSSSAFGSLKTMKPGVSIYGSRILDNYFSVRASLSFASLAGDDSKYPVPAWHLQRNFKFSTPVTEATATMVWDLFGNNGQDIVTKFSPYVLAGAGYAFLNIKRDWSGVNRSIYSAGSHGGNGLAEDSAHKVPKGVFVLPIGIGVKYSFAPNWAVTTELTYRYTFSDYIDGFSKAANPSSPDGYYSFTVGLAYTFGQKNFLKCPVFKKD